MLPPLCQIAFSQISAEIDALDARINELQNRLAGQSQTQAEHAGEMETSDEACRIRQRDLDTLTTHIAETELQLRRERQDLLMAESEITRHRSAVTNIPQLDSLCYPNSFRISSLHFSMFPRLET